MYFTVGIEVLHSEHIQAIAQEIPSGQLLTETDNPGMPVLVKDVVRALAEIRETTVEAIVHTVQSDLIELIRDDPWLGDTYARVLEGEQEN